MINLVKDGAAVKMIFTDSQYYLYGTGEILIPKNSLILVLDESDAITFRKAVTYDIFVSAPESQWSKSRSDIVAFYKENMVGSLSASGGDIVIDEDTIRLITDDALSDTSFHPVKNYVIKSEMDKKADKEDTFADGEYIWDSASQKMILRYYNVDGVAIDDIELFDTNANGQILLPNITF